jgi:hypothetical protein
MRDVSVRPFATYTRHAAGRHTGRPGNAIMAP